MRNWCLLAAVIFIPSSVSNGTAALVIPLNSSSWCPDCGKIRLQMEMASQCCRPRPATSPPLCSPLLLLSYPLLAQHYCFSGLSSSGDGFILNGFMLSYPEAPSLFHQANSKNIGGGRVCSKADIFNYIYQPAFSLCKIKCAVQFLVLLHSHLRLLKKQP